MLKCLFYFRFLHCLFFEILGGTRANILQKVDVPILANTDCQQWYKDEKKSLIVVDTALCAGLEIGGKDACQVYIF